MIGLLTRIITTSFVVAAILVENVNQSNKYVFQFNSKVDCIEY